MVGALCGILGVYVVLKKMSYIGHGLAHSIFGGAVLSYVLSFNFYVFFCLRHKIFQNRPRFQTKIPK